ncbi:MAG TPA: peptide deformylase [Dermatophilaceae bacterium]|nr:peptide deformylase [Dermatophilaceae bacterium]
MAVRNITVVGNRVLHQRTAGVEAITDDVRDLVRDMFDTMAAAHGVGLAANQVGVPLRLFVYDCPDDQHVRHRGHVINPVLEVAPEPIGEPDPEEDLEGCLSVPGESFPTARSHWARVRGIDLDGDPVELVGEGLFARMLQHETDHLDGWLYLDRLAGIDKRDSKKAVLARGWAKRKVLTWDPASQDADGV